MDIWTTRLVWSNFNSYPDHHPKSKHTNSNTNFIQTTKSYANDTPYIIFNQIPKHTNPDYSTLFNILLSFSLIWIKRNNSPPWLSLQLENPPVMHRFTLRFIALQIRVRRLTFLSLQSFSNFSLWIWVIYTNGLNILSLEAHYTSYL